MDKIKKISRRNKIRIASMAIAMLISLCAGLYQSSTQARIYKNQLEVVLSRSIDDLSGYLNELELSLGKGIYANTTPMISGLSSAIRRDSSAAENCLNHLPVNDLDMSEVYRLLNQIYDFNQEISGKVARGENLSDEDREQLLILSQSSAEVREKVSKLNNEIQMDKIELGGETRRANTKVNNVLYEGYSYNKEDISYPKAIKDGPFSDAVANENPIYIKDKAMISQEEARLAAAEFLNASPDELFDGEASGGLIELYSFKKGEEFISVTKQGGAVYEYVNSTPSNKITIDKNEAVRIATEFLNENGFSDIRNSYININNGICLLNFEYCQNKVTYYSDLIKVGISLETGELVYFDCKGFIMNHSDRKLPDEKFSFEQAKKALSPNLSVIDSARAVIPGANGNEILCYEFHCEGLNGDRALVYINTQTCEETNIFLLEYGDSSILVR